MQQVGKRSTHQDCAHVQAQALQQPTLAFPLRPRTNSPRLLPCREGCQFTPLAFEVMGTEQL
jgi:hypothetical protein